MKRKRTRKTEVIGVRLTERQRFEIDLISQVLPGAPTLTGIFEWAIEKACSNTPELADVTKVWSPFESDRFVRMAELYPNALDHDQARMWDFIQSRRQYWPIKPTPGVNSITVRPANQPPVVDRDQLGFNYRLLRETWSLVTAHVIEGQPWNETAFAEIAAAHGVDPASPLTAHMTHAPKEKE